MLATEGGVKTADAQGSMTVNWNEFGLAGVLRIVEYAAPLSVTDVTDTL